MLDWSNKTTRVFVVFLTTVVLFAFVIPMLPSLVAIGIDVSERIQDSLGESRLVIVADRLQLHVGEIATVTGRKVTINQYLVKDRYWANVQEQGAEFNYYEYEPVKEISRQPEHRQVLEFVGATHSEHYDKITMKFRGINPGKVKVTLNVSGELIDCNDLSKCPEHWSGLVSKTIELTVLDQ